MATLSLIQTLVFLLLLVVGNVSGQHQEPSQQQRQLQGDNNVLVEAFLCNAENFKFSDDQAVVNKGDSVRICIKTHIRAKVQKITIAKMIDFFFVREFDDAATMEQTLLENGIVANTNDVLTCQPGAELCVLETLPMDSFFGRDGRVSAIGSLLLQYDDGSIDIYRTAMPTVVPTVAPTMAPIGPSTAAPTAASPQNNNNNNNNTTTATETTDAPTSAPDQNDTTTPMVAVTTQSLHHNRQLVLEDPKKIVETSFAVATDENGTGFLADFREHWDSSPTYIKVLYVFAFIFFFLILFGVGFGLLLWAGFCGNARELLLPERFHHHRGEQDSVPGSKTRGDDGTMDESMGAFSPYARNRIQQEGVLLEEEEDQYDDEPEPMPKQIFVQRPMSSSLGRTDIEAPGPDAVPGRKRQPRWDPVRGKSIREGRRSIRDRSLAQKARMTRGSRQGTNVNPNRDLAASFLQGFPKKKIASVRTKTPRSVHDRNRHTMRSNNSVHEIPREKTASGVRWLQEKDQRLQQQSSHSASSRAPPSQRRGVNQQLQGSIHGSSAAFAPRRGGIVLHGNSIPKPGTAQRRPSPPKPTLQRPSTTPQNPAQRRPTPVKPPTKPAFSRGFPVIPEDASLTDEESSPSDSFDVDESSSPPTVLLDSSSSCEIPLHGTRENPRPID